MRSAPAMLKKKQVHTPGSWARATIYTMHGGLDWMSTVGTLMIFKKNGGEKNDQGLSNAP
jgi:hypothetical protein